MLTKDVTAKVQSFVSGNRIVIPHGTKLKAYFEGAEQFDTRGYLELKVNGCKYYIADDDYPADVVIDPSIKGGRIKIIYYVYIGLNSNWRGIISGQLTQLKGYGILQEADLYIHITDVHQTGTEVQDIILKIVPEAILSFSYENQFEYPALKLLHKLALQHPDCSFIYFHTKGMSHVIHSRSAEEITLFTHTFENWRRNLQLLKQDGIKKLGLFPANGSNNEKEKPGLRGGWIWYNFWYARGQYLAESQAPVLTDNRHYYEHWLGLHNQSEPIITGDCYNLYRLKKSDKTYFTPKEAAYHEANLIYSTLAGNLTDEMQTHNLLRKPHRIQRWLERQPFWNRFKF